MDPTLRDRLKKKGAANPTNMGVNKNLKPPGGPAQNVRQAIASAPKPNAGNWRSYKPGGATPTAGPNLGNNENLKEKLSYLRQRRDSLAANPVTQPNSPGSGVAGATVTQSGGKQQAKIDRIKQLLAQKKENQAKKPRTRDGSKPVSYTPR